MRKNSRKRKANKKPRIQRLNERSAQLSQQIAAINKRIENIARRDNAIRTEYAMAERRWGCVTQLAAKYGLHRSAIHRIIKHKDIAAPDSPATQKDPVRQPEGRISSPPDRPMPLGSQSKSRPDSGHKTVNAEATGQERASPSPPPGHSKSQSLFSTEWMRALNDIRDFAAKSSEPRIAQLLDSVIRGIKGEKGRRR